MKIFGFDFSSDKDKVYECTECTGMPSLIGMKTYGKPVLGKDSIFIGNGQYRTISPSKLDEDIIYTKHHLMIKLNRIK
jgi:hypothetical protein